MGRDTPQKLEGPKDLYTFWMFGFVESDGCNPVCAAHYDLRNDE